MVQIKPFRLFLYVVSRAGELFLREIDCQDEAEAIKHWLDSGRLNFGHLDDVFWKKTVRFFRPSFTSRSC